MAVGVSAAATIRLLSDTRSRKAVRPCMSVIDLAFLCRTLMAPRRKASAASSRRARLKAVLWTNSTSSVRTVGVNHFFVRRTLTAPALQSTASVPILEAHLDALR